MYGKEICYINLNILSILNGTFGPYDTLDSVSVESSSVETIRWRLQEREMLFYHKVRCSGTQLPIDHINFLNDYFFFAPVLKNNKYTKMNRLIYWKVLKLRHILNHIFQKVILHSINQCSFSWNGMASFAIGKWVGQIVLCQICFCRLSRARFNQQNILKWGASTRWSFGPNFAWGSKETTTIGKTHPTLLIWSYESKLLTHCRQLSLTIDLETTRKRENK